MTGHTWLATRIALALVLMVSFYVLALGIAGGLLWLAWADLTIARRVHPKVILFAAVGGLSILWAVMPRRDRFEAPGPAVAPAHEPELFQVLQEVASATRQDMPADVFVVNEVNAFVTQRGGVMGLGSHRVMGLGLPLMQALTVQEFKAVLAHEFGHYHAGDVRLGPWIHKTRAAIGRTIEQLSGSILQRIFIWYGSLFLRITHAVSRRQEFIADEVAARAAGAGAMVSGLRKLHASAVAFQSYWRSELSPILSSGHLPPVSQGFSRFMQTERVASGLARAVQKEEADGTTDPFDTHPSLKERIAALRPLPEGAAGDERPATALLSDLGAWERRVLGAVVNDEWARGLKPVTWDRVVPDIYIPMWRDRVKDHAAAVRDLRVGHLPLPRLELVRRGSTLAAEGEGLLTDDERANRMTQLLATATGLALIDSGWTPESAPGEEIWLQRGAHVFRPFSEVLALRGDALSVTKWRERCASLGITDVPLGGMGEAS